MSTLKMALLRYKWHIVGGLALLATILIYIASLDDEHEERFENIKLVEDWLLESRRELLKSAKSEHDRHTIELEEGLQKGSEVRERLDEGLVDKEVEIDEMDSEELSSFFTRLGY